MKRIFLILAVMIAAGAAAQSPGPPTTGPGPLPAPSTSPSPSRPTAPSAGRNDLWQLLTPEQRDQLWKSLTPEQRSDVWRGLQPQERREMRDRLEGGDPRGAASAWSMRRRFGAGDGARTDTMTPEERQQMREQVREAHRLRRERMEAERARTK